MLRRIPILRALAVLSLGLTGGATADAQLADKSPFLPPASGGTAAPTAGAPLEFRGTMQTAEGLKVRIVDPARRAGAWLRVNERDPSFDFVVKQYDSEHDTAVVDYQGRSITLAQHVAKVASAGSPQNFVPGAQVNGVPMPAAITQSVVVNPTPADEQRRLDAVAAEVARRRALREQAAQQVSQGMPVAPQVMQQQQQNQNNGGQNNNAGAQRGQRGARPGQGRE